MSVFFSMVFCCMVVYFSSNRVEVDNAVYFCFFHVSFGICVIAIFSLRNVIT